MTVGHQSATKFASVLQIYIILPACDTAKIRTAFLILRKKKKTITNIFNRVNRLIISLLNTVMEKKIKAWKTECEDRRVAG